MAEKRRASTRSRSDALPRKRRQSALNTYPDSEPGQYDIQFPAYLLPSKIIDGKPLPTIRGSLSIPSQSLQSISQSGVLAASLNRSRNTWLNENILERYWTKPTKKKPQTEITNNPPKESMQKIGQCRLIIEPHLFDATLFAIHAAPIQHFTPVASTMKSLNHKGLPLPILLPTKSENSQSFTNPTGVLDFSKPALLAPAPFSLLPSIPQPSAALSSPFQNAQPPPIPSSKDVLYQPTTNSQTYEVTTTLPHIASAIPVQPKPSQDPVIQMLAQRASTNSELKSLMKIVASGNASPEQLRVFQNHIDDLTAIIHRQKQNNIISHAGPTAFNGNAPFKTASGLPSLFRPGNSNMMYGRPASYHPPPPPPPKPKQIPPPKPEIVGVAIEFSGLSFDRYSFPKNSILEFSQNAKQLIASFLITRKRGSKEGSADEVDKEYYQPITITFQAENPAIFDAIAKSVCAQEEVCKYMEDVMTRLPSAEDVKLMMQLPFEETDILKDDSRMPSNSLVGRQHSLLNLTTSLIPGGGNMKTSSKRSEEWDQRCRHCFASMAAGQSRIEEQVLCHECKVLEGTTPSKTSSCKVPPRSMHSRHSSGPRSLTIFGEVF